MKIKDEYQYVHYKTREEKELRNLCSENNVRIVASTLGNDGYWKSRIEGDFDNVHKVSNLWKNLQFNRPIKDSYYLARKIAKWIISHNNGNKVCTTNDIKEVAKHVYGEEASNRTISDVKAILTKEGSVNLKDALNNAYLKKADERELAPHIKRILKSLAENEPQYKGVFGANNIVENRVWNELKKEGLLTKFPTNLYSIIREVMSNQEIKKLFQKETFRGVYSFKKGERADAFKQYLRDRGIAFEPSEDGERVVFVVPKADEAVDRRANEIVKTLRDFKGQTYLKKEDQKDLVPHIERILKSLAENEPQYKGSLGWANIVENRVWNELKKEGLLTKFPTNLYSIIREVMRNKEIKNLFQKETSLNLNKEKQEEKGIILYPASEHKEYGGTYYGYVSVNHPTLGEFYVSVEAFGKKVRIDGIPWNFLKKYPLTPEQRDWVTANEKDLKEAMRRGIKIVLNDSKVDIKDKVEDLEEVILDSIRHFKYDLGETPEVSDIIEDVLANYDIIDEEETPELTARLYKEIALVARRNNITLRDKKSKDSFAMLKVGDSLDKEEAKKKILEIIANPRYVKEDYEGSLYLTTESYKLIDDLAKESGLTRSEMKNLHQYLFKEGFYSIGIKDSEFNFYGRTESYEAHDLLFALQVMYGQPKWGYEDFKKINLTEEEIKEALDYVKRKELNKYTYFEDSDDPLAEENLDRLFEKFKGDEDKVLDELRKLELDIPNGDLQGVVEAHKMTFKDSEETNQYQELLKLLSGSYPQEFGLEPFLYDAMSEYKDFVSLYEVIEGQEELPEKPLVVLTYLFNELEDEKDNWESRLKVDKKRLEYMYELKEMNSPEPEDAKFLIVGLLKNDSRPKEVKIGDSEKAVWLCKYWSEDPEDKKQLNDKLRSLGLTKKLVNEGKDAEIIGDKKSIEKFMSWMGITPSRFKEIKIQDMRLTRKQKMWYAEELSKSVDPQFLRRNYRLKKIKGERKK